MECGACGKVRTDSPSSAGARNVSVWYAATFWTLAEATAFVTIDYHITEANVAWRHERPFLISGSPMRQAHRVSKLMGPHDVGNVPQPPSNNHRFRAALGSPRASDERRSPFAEVDRPDNLDVGNHAMDRFEIGCVVYVLWRRSEGFDSTIQFECHGASISVFQQRRRALQDLFDLSLSQRPHVLVNTDFQWAHCLSAGWLNPQQQTKTYNHNDGLHFVSCAADAAPETGAPAHPPKRGRTCRHVRAFFISRGRAFEIT